MFQTEYEEWLYATDGGTAFLVNYRGKVYGVTCRHVLKNFESNPLIITGERYPKKGAKPALVRGKYFPSSPSGAAEGSDLLDLCVVEFLPEITPLFFSDPAYIIDDNTVCRSHDGHRLQVFGCLEEMSSIEDPDINAGFGMLEFQDAGVATFDPLLRTAISEFRQPEFSRIGGISGSPVYDVTANALCGMAMRGGMTDNKSTLHFIDAIHIVETLKAIDKGATHTSYTTGAWVRTEK